MPQVSLTRIKMKQKIQTIQNNKKRSLQQNFHLLTVLTHEFLKFFAIKLNFTNMKNILLTSTILASISLTATAQEATTKSKQPPQRQAMWEYGTGADQKVKGGNFQTASADGEEMGDNRMGDTRDPSRRELREQRQDKYRGGQSGQSQGMGGPGGPHQEIFKNLTEDQRKAVKVEMERHRAAMKQITGVDIVGPGPNGDRPEGDKPNGDSSSGANAQMPKDGKNTNMPKDKMPQGDMKPRGDMNMTAPEKGFMPQDEGKSGSTEMQEQRPERKRFMRNPSRRQAGEDSVQSSSAPEQAQ